MGALSGQDRKTTCCWCCRRGALALRVVLDRTAYVCGENIRIRAQVENRQSSQQAVLIKLIQHVEFFIDKGVLGESKSVTCLVFEHKSPVIPPNSQGKYDSTLEQPIRLPVVPPTLIGVCRLLQIYYVLRVCLADEKGNESLHLEFPVTVATVPYRIPNAAPPSIDYGKYFCANHVEGGKYVSPEFRLGQVYDGEINEEGREEEVVLYRPVYAKIAERRVGSPPTTKDLRSGSFTRIADSSQSMITESNGRRRSIIINSPVMSEQRDIKLQSQLSLKIEG
ncbi:arrestin domain protein, partial [Oesophagostomum dentatum]